MHQIYEATPNQALPPAAPRVVRAGKKFILRRSVRWLSLGRWLRNTMTAFQTKFLSWITLSAVVVSVLSFIACTYVARTHSKADEHAMAVKGWLFFIFLGSWIFSLVGAAAIYRRHELTKVSLIAPIFAGAFTGALSALGLWAILSPLLFPGDDGYPFQPIYAVVLGGICNLAIFLTAALLVFRQTVRCVREFRHLKQA